MFRGWQQSTRLSGPFRRVIDQPPPEINSRAHLLIVFRRIWMSVRSSLAPSDLEWKSRRRANSSIGEHNIKEKSY